MNKNPILYSLTLFLIWVSITIFGAEYFSNGKHIELEDFIRLRPSYNIYLACFVLLIYTFIRKITKGVGFTSNLTIKNWIYVYPVAIILLLQITIFWKGQIDTNTFILVLANTFAVGLSEELMFRGILLNSFVQKFSFFKSAIIVSLLFGGVHILNGFITGNFSQGLMQASFATFSGILFIGIRVKSINIIPAIIIHWLWDFSVFAYMSFISEKVKEEPIVAAIAILMGISPVIFGILGIIQCRKKEVINIFIKNQLSS